jgi:hypothetical protein
MMRAASRSARKVSHALISTSRISNSFATPLANRIEEGPQRPPTPGQQLCIRQRLPCVASTAHMAVLSSFGI